jgi:hypothetical protein
MANLVSDVMRVHWLGLSVIYLPASIGDLQ